MSASMPQKKRQKIKVELSSEEEDDEKVKDIEFSHDEDGVEGTDEETGIGAQTNEQGETFFELSSSRRCTVRSFKGKVLIDIREFYDKNGKKLPGKKGISLTADQYEELKKAVAGGHIDSEIKKLEKKGK